MTSVNASYTRNVFHRHLNLIHLPANCYFFLIAVILTLSFAQAQEPKTAKPVILDFINITATRSERSPAQIPNSITQITHNPQHNYQPGATLDEFARGTPGVFFQNQFNFAQDLRIAIRGFGARSPFGVRGIQMRVDGIPQTLPDGQTQLDSIDPSLIERMDIIRGPPAALYGNASGGMIDITTREAPQEKFVIMPRQVFGQYGYLKSELYMGGRSGNFSYGVFGSHLQQEGWRDHSAMQNTFSLKGWHRRRLIPRSCTLTSPTPATAWRFTKSPCVQAVRGWLPHSPPPMSFGKKPSPARTTGKTGLMPSLLKA
jgi:iron complex outermembrane receptor protein